MTRWLRCARLVLLTGVALALASPPAWGYVRKKTDGGLDEYWQPNCVQVNVYIYDFDRMSRDEIAKSVSAAAHTWSPSAVTCPDGTSHPFFEVVPSLAAPGKKAAARVRRSEHAAILHGGLALPGQLVVRRVDDRADIRLGARRRAHRRRGRAGERARQ